MTAKPNPAATRVAFSPKEFAALFGRSQTWGYRQIYAGLVNAISDRGRIMIPAAEVDKILASASRYENRPVIQKPAKDKLFGLSPAQQSAWQAFFRARRGTAPLPAAKPPARAPLPANAGSRGAILARLTRRKTKT